MLENCSEEIKRNNEFELKKSSLSEQLKELIELSPEYGEEKQLEDKRKFITVIENSIIETLKDFKISSFSDRKKLR